MQATKQILSPVRVEIRVEVPSELVEAQATKEYTALAKTASVKGFRKGNLPNSLLHEVFARQVREKVVNNIVHETLPKVLVEQEVSPLVAPSIRVEEDSSGSSSFSYVAECEVAPDLPVVQYEGLVLIRPSSAVSEKEVDEELEKIRERAASWVSPESVRPAIAGDLVIGDLSVCVPGKPDQKSQNVHLYLSPGYLLPDVEQSLLGKSIGDRVLVNSVVPQEVGKGKGKKVTCRIDIKELKVKQLPVMDDEWAKDIGEFTTLSSLRESLRERLEKQKTMEGDAVLADQIMELLNKQNPLELPATLVEQQRKLVEQEALEFMKTTGQLWSPPGSKSEAPVKAGEEGLTSAATGEKLTEHLRALFEKEAARRVHAGFLMASIAKKNDIQVLQEDFENAYAEIAEETNRSVSRVKSEYVRQEKRQMLAGMILEDKVFRLIQSVAQVQEQSASAG